MSKRYLKTCASKGLTLIEVVASMALLSALLVIMLSTYARHIRQINLADQRIRACDALDQLLARLVEDNELPPSAQAGTFPGAEEFAWRTIELPSRVSHENWKTKTVRFEVVALDSNEVLTSVEVLTQDTSQLR